MSRQKPHVRHTKKGVPFYAGRGNPAEEGEREARKQNFLFEKTGFYVGDKAFVEGYDEPVKILNLYASTGGKYVHYMATVRFPDGREEDVLTVNLGRKV